MPDLRIEPASASLTSRATQRFVASTSSGAAPEATWEVLPPQGTPAGSAGEIDPEGLYTAPEQVASRIDVVVRATRDGETATATVTLTPAPQNVETPGAVVTPAPSAAPVPGTIKVSPETAVLGAGQTQSFTAVDASGTAASVTWSLHAPEGVGPEVTGQIDPATGAYTAPRLVTVQRFVSVVATAPSGQSDKALIVLAPGKVSVIPGDVVLRAAEVQQFQAQVSGDERAAVVWLPPSPTVGVLDERGQYRAPDKVAEDQTVIITATSMVSRDQGQARITLLADPWTGYGAKVLGAWLLCLFFVPLLLSYIWPPPPDRSKLNAAMADRQIAEKTLEEAQRGQKAITDPNAASLQAARVESAQRDLNAKDAAVKLEQALLDQAAKDEFRLLMLVVLAGGLGSFVHLTRSFVDFVGNRRLRPSWAWWYILQPFTGSALAIVVYLVLRGGFLTGVSGSNLNPYGFVAMAALVGLFSKQATNKLDELFSTMFRTDKERELKDKLTARNSRQPQQSPPPGAP